MPSSCPRRPQAFPLLRDVSISSTSASIQKSGDTSPNQTVTSLEEQVSVMEALNEKLEEEILFLTRVLFHPSYRLSDRKHQQEIDRCETLCNDIEKVARNRRERTEQKLTKLRLEKSIFQYLQLVSCP